LNKTLVKGFLAGVVIGCVWIPYALIVDAFSLDQVEGEPIWIYFVFSCVLPMLLIYFAGRAVTIALGLKVG